MVGLDLGMGKVNIELGWGIALGLGTVYSIELEDKFGYNQN